MTRIGIMGICMSLLSLAGVAVGGTIHVPADHSTIQAAIDAAVDGDEIEVAPGMYQELIDFNGKAVRLHSSGGAAITTIDGGSLGTVVTCAKGEGVGTSIKGFTITGGNANYGAGMFIDHSNLLVSNCTVSGNTASYGGGGIYQCSVGNDSTFANCTFSGNTARRGGGILNEIYSSPTFINCSFTDNSAISGYAGGMFNDIHSSPTLINCTFQWNRCAYTGGGMYNNILSNPTLINCTFNGNGADSTGGGIYSDDVSCPTVTNCILWGNSGFEVGGLATVKYSNIQGGFPGIGNIDADPMFADADGRLLPGSPCIDAGDNSVVSVATDLDGNPRIVGPAVDMGAYEASVATAIAGMGRTITDEVDFGNIDPGVGDGLLDKVEAALSAVERGSIKAAIGQLNALINQTNAQAGKRINPQTAEWLIARAEAIIAALSS